jgi:FMN phosphatase YigB (HAD superfamily)
MKTIFKFAAVILGALNVGMQTAWVNRADHLWSQPQEPHATVTSMLELCDLLGAE